MYHKKENSPTTGLSGPTKFHVRCAVRLHSWHIHSPTVPDIPNVHQSFKRNLNNINTFSSFSRGVCLDGQTFLRSL